MIRHILRHAYVQEGQVLPKPWGEEFLHMAQRYSADSYEPDGLDLWWIEYQDD